MNEYHTYYEPVGRDPTTKYVIKRGKIEIYKKNGVFLASLRKWHFRWSFEITAETQILEEHVSNEGNGWVTLGCSDKDSSRHTFFIWRQTEQFVRDLKAHGFL